MQYILTCPNGKKIDMTRDVLDQMEGKTDSLAVLKKITYYFLANFFFTLPKKSKGIILCYHRASNSKVYDKTDPNNSLTVSIQEFRNQILKIQSKYRIVSLKEFLLHINSDSNEFLVVVTFDDGYYDNFTDLLPIISELKIPITIYITTSFLSKNKSCIWWYELWHYIKLNNKLIFDGYNYDISRYKNKLHFFVMIFF